MSGRSAAELIVKRCVERPCVAFDGKAGSIVVLADMHGDELLGAVGNKFACGFGGLVVGEVPPRGQDSLLKKARIFSLA